MELPGCPDQLLLDHSGVYVSTMKSRMLSTAVLSVGTCKALSIKGEDASALAHVMEGRNCMAVTPSVVQVKGQRRIAFDQFVNALGIIAEKKGQALRDVVQAVLDTGGPSVIGTRAGYVKFHDDKVGCSMTACA